jgi:hypothetical protein
MKEVEMEAKMQTGENITIARSSIFGITPSNQAQ